MRTETRKKKKESAKKQVHHCIASITKGYKQ
jgi:hypothetical protein